MHASRRKDIGFRTSGVWSRDRGQHRGGKGDIAKP